MPIEFIQISNDDISTLKVHPETEMSIQEQAFLIKLLKKSHPNNILEIGLAAGGTSVSLLKNTDSSQHIYGIDISETYYRNTNEEAGYLIEKLCTTEQIARYKKFLGKDTIYRVSEIANIKFDFVVLDTSHILPGELLSFFAIYRLLSPGCIVVLHDLLLNFSKFNAKTLWYRRHSYATNVLFSSIGSHHKYLPAYERPNIGAFTIDDQTEENFESSFMALSQTWATFPSTEILNDYYKFIKNNYSIFCSNYFKICIKAQEKLIGGKW